MPATAPAIAAPAPPPAISWSADPIAARILADLAKNPPECVDRVATYARTRDEWVEYIGERVDRLREIERRWARDAMLALDAGDHSEMDALRQVDPLNRDPGSVPPWLRLSGSVDRVIYERVSS